jgi:putative acetyltransferase
MVIRAFRIGDEPALHRVFLSAIHGIAIRDYTPEQIDAWAPKTLDPNLWAERMQDIAPFVAEHEGIPIAYADVQVNGYVVEERMPVMRGVAIPNALMAKTL